MSSQTETTHTVICDKSPHKDAAAHCQNTPPEEEKGVLGRAADSIKGAYHKVVDGGGDDSSKRENAADAIKHDATKTCEKVHDKMEGAREKCDDHLEKLGKTNRPHETSAQEHAAAGIHEKAEKTADKVHDKMDAARAESDKLMAKTLNKQQ